MWKSSVKINWALFYVESDNLDLAIAIVRNYRSDTWNTPQFFMAHLPTQMMMRVRMNFFCARFVGWANLNFKKLIYKQTRVRQYWLTATKNLVIFLQRYYIFSNKSYQDNIMITKSRNEEKKHAHYNKRCVSRLQVKDKLMHFVCWCVCPNASFSIFLEYTS